VKLLRFISLVSILVWFACVFGIAADAPQSTYHLAKTYKFGAAPGGAEYFDYITVDPQARRVFLSHGSEVLVMNADTGAIQGKISGFKRQHGVALAHDIGRGFITDGDAGSVTIFDLKTLQKISDVKAAEDADCVVYDAVSKRVFTLNGDPNNSTAIDAKEGKVVGTVALGGKPEFAVADGKGMIYANLVDKNEVVAFDSRTLQAKSHWPVAPAGSPVSMAMDRKNRRLFIGARNPAMLVVMNADSGQVLQTFPISGGVDAAVYDPETARVFVSTRDGYIHIFHQDSPDKLSEAGQVKTEVGAKTMGYDPKTQNLITDTSDFGAPTAKGRPNPIPGTFRVLVFSK
jgi:DNA-binding beta-propeller fold protein YncE